MREWKMQLFILTSSPPAFSTPAILPVSHFPLQHFQRFILPYRGSGQVSPLFDMFSIPFIIIIINIIY